MVYATHLSPCECVEDFANVSKARPVRLAKDVLEEPVRYGAYPFVREDSFKCCGVRHDLALCCGCEVGIRKAEDIHHARRKGDGYGFGLMQVGSPKGTPVFLST